MTGCSALAATASRTPFAALENQRLSHGADTGTPRRKLSEKRCRRDDRGVEYEDGMRWPRGKWNGQRIAGVRLVVRLNVFWWRLGLPARYGGCLSLGPVHVWLTPDYEDA
jgi:hypothetical protein